MDFGTIELDDETQRFWADVRAFVAEHVTDEVHEEEWRTGAGMNLALHLALGERGWLAPTWPVEEGGAGLTRQQAAILADELAAARAPTITTGTTMLVVPAVRRFGSPELQAEVLPGVARGEVRICLGYTEPDTGSDLANVKTRAVRDGDEWVIDGQKMFTTGAQNCQYTFLATRTNLEMAKHKGMTMFLVPLASPGVEIRAVHTLGGERTNMVFYDQVRVADRYRLGPVDDGWAVLNGPLSAEHAMGDDASEPDGMGGSFTRVNAATLDAVVVWARQPGADGRRPIDDSVVRRRLAEIALDVELSRVSPGPMGRILTSELLIQDTAALMDVVGPAAVIQRGGDGAVADGAVEHAHRYAQGTATYGGTTEIYRNIIAEHMLGLPRSRPR